ncbi:hypothetical protein [Paenibacillus hexagrammi]|uniref:Uncharacterized protein n=1 Tax=Paenibacillus hexagrammi TaxID=2908839 RepID=A0ABY3SFD8_9BACL|nr:hypothetical protein [Paenibacillus sp. YPD9-1]UJF32621.1 hypothetical protein L0M14_23785 [Paenibacillus sp. YPD9-1]
MSGKFYITANGYNSYELLDADASFIFKIAKIVTEKFHFTHANPAVGIEQAFMDFVKDGIRITLGWDTWSGCFVMAHDHLGNKYIEEIGNYLDEHPILDK